MHIHVFCIQYVENQRYNNAEKQESVVYSLDTEFHLQVKKKKKKNHLIFSSGGFVLPFFFGGFKKQNNVLNLSRIMKQT